MLVLFSREKYIVCVCARVCKRICMCVLARFASVGCENARVRMVQRRTSIKARGRDTTTEGSEIREELIITWKNWRLVKKKYSIGQKKMTVRACVNENLFFLFFLFLVPSYFILGPDFLSVNGFHAALFPFILYSKNRCPHILARPSLATLYNYDNYLRSFY